MPAWIPHEPEDPFCPCWTCANKRQAEAAEAKRKGQMMRAKDLSVGVTVRRLGPGADGKHDLFEIERNGRTAQGTLIELQTPGAHSDIVDPFMELRLSQRFDVLRWLRVKHEITLAECWERWDQEEKVLEEETARDAERARRR